MTQLMARLDGYYQTRGIHSLDFRCIHEASCSSGCKEFTPARASFVGKGYGDPFRIVVLSLDPGKGWPDPGERTLRAVAERIEADDVDSMPKNRHWYRTYETVAAVITAVIGKKLEPKDVVGRFAHVNAAKCSHNLPGNKQAPRRLFENCRAFLDGELEILGPDVVITQGNRAARVVKPWVVPSLSTTLLTLGERSAYWLEMPHPTAWGGLYVRDQKDWARRFDDTRRWLQSQPGRLAADQSTRA